MAGRLALACLERIAGRHNERKGSTREDFQGPGDTTMRCDLKGRAVVRPGHSGVQSVTRRLTFTGVLVKVILNTTLV